MTSAAAARTDDDEPASAAETDGVSASAAEVDRVSASAGTLAPARPRSRSAAVGAPPSTAGKAKRASVAGESRSHPPARRRPPRPPSRPRGPFVLLIVGILAAGLVTLLLLNTATAKGSFRQRALTQQQQQLALKAQQLQREVNAKSAPEALRKAAEKLGMVPGGDPVFLVVGPDGAPTVVGTPVQITSPPPAPDFAKAQAAKLAQEKAAASASAAKASQSLANQSKVSESAGNQASGAASGASAPTKAASGHGSAVPTGNPSGAQGGAR
jgi:hypothetical protein